jgi:hypothetical protein
MFDSRSEASIWTSLAVETAGFTGRCRKTKSGLKLRTRLKNALSRAAPRRRRLLRAPVLRGCGSGPVVLLHTGRGDGRMMERSRVACYMASGTARTLRGAVVPRPLGRG